MARDQDSASAESVHALRGQVVGIDQEVPLLDGTEVPYAYLDNAASTPAFVGVQRKVDELLLWYSSVHRGTGFKSLVSTRAYERARRVVGEFVGADPELDCVIFGKNATEAINKLSARIGLRPDDVVLCSLLEHHSNDLPWRSRAHVEHVGLRADGSLSVDELSSKLDLLEGRVKLLAVTGASNVTGFVPPIHDVAELAHKAGARILVDCAQLSAHRAIDMQPHDSASHLDFVVLSGHKIYAPFGTGALVGPKEVFREGAPEYRGGGTIEIVTTEDVYWAEPPERDEAGSPNVVGAVALAASIGILSEVGMDAIADHEAELTSYALAKLDELREVTVFGSRDPHRLSDRLGVITFVVDGMPHGKVAAIMGFEGGIGVRNGCFCAHPYVLKLLEVSDEEYRAHRERVLAHDRSTLPGMVRVSFGCYNTFEEVDRFVEMLRRVIAGTYIGDYAVDERTGQYYPRDFDPSVIDRYFTPQLGA
jgi:selenocysteine lyase/cysteine desulfurase